MSYAYDDDENNPFADPSIRQHTQMAGTTSSGGFNYGGTARQVQPAPMGAPPTYQEETPRLNNDDLLRRQEELDRKAAELQRKEQELKNQAAASGGPRSNNFPPLPSFIPLNPCFYQDFDVDIPAAFRQTVQRCYYIWLVYLLALVYNWIASGAYYIVVPDASIKLWLIPLVYIVLFTPCSYVCWFRPVYNAFRADSSFNFFLFFFMFFFQFCTCILFAIGFKTGDTAMMGWLSLIDAFDKSLPGGIVIMISPILFTLLAIGMGIMLQRVHSLYRTTDASFSKAQAEFSTGVMSNQTVQKATASAATAAAKNAFSGSGSTS